jgi:hypothetical protein
MAGELQPPVCCSALGHNQDGGAGGITASGSHRPVGVHLGHLWRLAPLADQGCGIG